MQLSATVQPCSFTMNLGITFPLQSKKLKVYFEKRKENCFPAECTCFGHWKKMV